MEKMEIAMVKVASPAARSALGSTKAMGQMKMLPKP